jgi:hypothetical protein
LKKNVVKKVARWMAERDALKGYVAAKGSCTQGSAAQKVYYPERYSLVMRWPVKPRITNMCFVRFPADVVMDTIAKRIALLEKRLLEAGIEDV